MYKSMNNSECRTLINDALKMRYRACAYRLYNLWVDKKIEPSVYCRLFTLVFNICCYDLIWFITKTKNCDYNVRSFFNHNFYNFYITKGGANYVTKKKKKSA